MLLATLFAQADPYSSYTSAGTDSTNAAGAAIFGGAYLLFWLAVAVVTVIGMWKVFEKAGRPGWAAIVPFYNSYVLVEISGRPGWWFILYFIPIVNIVVSLLVSMDIAKAFGKSQVFGVVALWLFGPVGYLMLGFGDAKYHGALPAGSAPSTPTPPSAPTPPAPAPPTVQ